MSYKKTQLQWPVRAVVDLNAFQHNLRQMRRLAPQAQQLAVVKANAYGHGMEQISLAALQAGAQWLGVAKAAEAYDLRKFLDKQGIKRDHFVDTPTSAMMRSRLYRDKQAALPTSSRPRILAWLYGPSTELEPVVGAEIDLSVSTPDQLDQVAHAADASGLRARIHLKIDTGLSRGGSTLGDLDVLCKLAKARERSGLVEVSALWSHFSRADEASEEAEEFTKSQLAAFERGTQVALECGLTPKLRHIAASGGILWYPESHLDMVRVGITAYGLSPNPEVASSADLGIVPVMRLETEVVQVKRLCQATPVSYGGNWVASQDVWVALLPIGYADGILRSAANQAKVWVGGRIATIVGRVPMDQVIVNLGPALDSTGAPLPPPVQAGDLAVIFGDPCLDLTPDNGDDSQFAPGDDWQTRPPKADQSCAHFPSVDDLARASSTISYEILSGIDRSVPRVYVPATEK